MKTKLQYGLMILFAILIVGFIVIGLNQKEKAESLKRDIDNHNIPSKVEKQVSISDEDTKTYEDLLKDKIDDFLNGKYSDDNFFESGTGGNVFYSIFTASGIKGITEDSSEKEIKERYKHFDYKLYNVTAQKNTDGEVQINANIEVDANGKKIENGYNLFSVTFDANGNLERGTLYAEQ